MGLLEIDTEPLVEVCMERLEIVNAHGAALLIDIGLPGNKLRAIDDALLTRVRMERLGVRHAY